mgnify:CR=1 FL=1
MRLDYITEEFALAVLVEAFERNRSGVATRKELKDIVGGAVQICIETNRAVRDHLMQSECPCRTRQAQSQGL